MERNRDKLVILVLALLLQSCTWVEEIISPDHSDWEISPHTLNVSSDLPGEIWVICDKVPEDLQWSTKPEGVVEVIPTQDPTRYTIKYISDGEGIISLKSGPVKRECTFISKKYSDTGLHLKINGSDIYFPMITHNGEGDGTSKITRIFRIEVPRDTLKVEFVKFIPERVEELVIVRNIFVFDDGYHFECTQFTEYTDEYRVSGTSLSYNDSIPNFHKVKGVKVTQSAFASHPEVSEITLEMNTNAFENGYGKSCCFRIILSGSS